ncbi:MAG: UDP-N-acetylglucosamine 2-epimerase (non-hydrolyzing) [Candidatus Omnitrophota bacterium]
MSIKVINVVGTRPNYMKMAPLIEEMKKYPRDFSPLLVHTGQHYDKEMCHLFFDDLKMAQPDINLEVGSGSHAQQTAAIMVKFERVLMSYKPDLVMVVGDVNSAFACALVARKMRIKVAHVEAGLRSFDERMPEEINRRMIDAMSEYLFTTSDDDNRNLLNEAIPRKKIYFVGNIMIQTLLKFKELAQKRKILQDFKLKPKEFALVTMHRPENVDQESTFLPILKALRKISKKLPIIFPAHPRTIEKIKVLKIERCFQEIKEYNINNPRGIFILPPLGYLDFVNLMSNCRFILTDSGGIQEEATLLRVPCFTLRDNTERPITIRCGGNILVGTKEQRIVQIVSKAMGKGWRKVKLPKYWDNQVAKRIVSILRQELT